MAEVTCDLYKNQNYWNIYKVIKCNCPALLKGLVGFATLTQDLGKCLSIYI